MPLCCIVKCGAKKKENQPQLSLHRFPKNEELRIKWLEAIGEENINPRHKQWYVCSLHFEERCFNRTLDVMRLHDNSVPTIFSTFNKKPHKESSVFCETSNIQKSDVSCISTVMPPPQLTVNINSEKQQFNMPVCCIVNCGERKKENQPQLSLHRFPKNEELRKKWLDAIGEVNINPQYKQWYICSLHFEESCFDRTFDEMRLHDNSVPTIFSVCVLKFKIIDNNRLVLWHEINL